MQEREKEYKTKLAQSEQVTKQLQDEVAQLRNELAALRITTLENK
jgi:hypothetical protein